MGASASNLHPHLRAEWHPTKNGDLHPETVRTAAKAWWRCSRDPSHEWQATVASRKRGNGCPFCAGRRADGTNCLAVVAPQIAEEWHPTLNGTLTAHDVTAGSQKKVWWRCKRNPTHAWRATIALRKRKGCPFCSGRRVTMERSLASCAPSVAAEWHPSKNGSLTPDKVTRASDNLVWWRCSREPEHEWQERVVRRTSRGDGCPYCSRHRVTAESSLATKAPALAAQWHPTKNGLLTPWDVAHRSGKLVWWKCPAGPDHEWRATPSNRAASPGCPFCSNKRLSVTNSLATLFPKLAGQWNTKRNGDLTPAQVTAATTRKVWWLCPFEHEWQQSPNYRTNLTAACPLCPKSERRQAMTRRRPREIVRLPSDWT
jgi:hypothetical protein